MGLQFGANEYHRKVDSRDSLEYERPLTISDVAVVAIVVIALLALFGYITGIFHFHFHL